VLELHLLGLEEISLTLQDQTAYEHCWLIDPHSGQLAVWTEDGGIDGLRLDTFRTISDQAGGLG